MEGEGGRGVESSASGQLTIRGDVNFSLSQEDYERYRDEDERDTKPNWSVQAQPSQFGQGEAASQNIDILQQQPTMQSVQLQQLPDGQLIYTTIENQNNRIVNINDDIVNGGSQVEQLIKPNIQVLDTTQLNSYRILDEPIDQKPLTKQPDVLFKKPIFFQELHTWYETSDHTDAVIKVKDGEKRVHSLVLGAASSLFRFMFAEISDKILDAEFTICAPDLTLKELEENLLKPMYGYKPQSSDASKDKSDQAKGQDQENGENVTLPLPHKQEIEDSPEDLLSKIDSNPQGTQEDNSHKTGIFPKTDDFKKPEGRQPLKPMAPNTVHVKPYGINIDFNEGGIYEARLKKDEKDDKKKEAEKSLTDSFLQAEAENYEYMIPPHKIKQERKKSRTRHGYNYDSFVESSDEDYKPEKIKTKHGYKYDSFVEESDSNTDDDLDDLDFDENKPRKRGRPKGSSNKRKYQKRVKQEPMISVKEEAIDKTYDEFHDMFVQKTQITRNAEIKFAQDHIGFYHCQEDGCSFKTMVRPSIHQHHKFTHQNLHGYQEALLGCTYCGESWVNQIYYRKHVNSGECKQPNPVIPYVCENCGQGWYNLTNYTKHAEARECKTNTSHIGKKPCSQDDCPLTFFSDSNRKTHEDRAHKPPPSTTMYRCAKCNINFANHKDFNVHKKDVHGEKSRGGFVTYACKVAGCEFQHAQRKPFEAHVREQHPNDCYICELCGRNFADQYKLDQHKDNNPNGRGGKRCLPVSYTCTHCPREFNRKRHMELHVLFKHTQERPFGCDQCGKRFKTRHCVNVHLRTHGVGGFSWCCEECGKTFNQISSYHTHLKVHSNVRDFACEDCGMTFKLKNSLKKHQLVHKPEFGHTCDFCGKKFKRSDNLINHRRRHTGEHPYKCDKCNWTGPDSSSFIHHKKKHADTNQHTQEIKLIHAISKLPTHLLENRDTLARADSVTHSDIL